MMVQRGERDQAGFRACMRLGNDEKEGWLLMIQIPGEREPERERDQRDADIPVQTCKGKAKQIIRERERIHVHRRCK